jgi:hypothetical protein
MWLIELVGDVGQILLRENPSARQPGWFWYSATLEQIDDPVLRDIQSFGDIADG